MMLIGVTGKAKSGKNTVAELIGGHALAFAFPIKEACRIAFKLSYSDLHGETKEDPQERLGGKSPRQIMQWFGTDFGRLMIADEIWITRAEEAYEELRAFQRMSYNTHRPIIFTDCRFDNEAEWIKSQGGIIIEVIRHSAGSVATHASESGVNPYLIDHTVLNNGTKEHLAEQLRGLEIPMD